MTCTLLPPTECLFKVGIDFGLFRNENCPFKKERYPNELLTSDRSHISSERSTGHLKNQVADCDYLVKTFPDDDDRRDKKTLNVVLIKSQKYLD